MQFYQFKEGDSVQLRPDVRELVGAGKIDNSFGYVTRDMCKLIGKKLEVKYVDGGYAGNVQLIKLENCPNGYSYNSEWLMPWELTGLDKIRQEAQKL